jgi:thioredoxin-like negative regulator of GroEL
VVLDESSGTDWQRLPLEGNAGNIVAAFRKLPHRQLVVLGEAGAGKSVLAILLTLGLIKSPEPGQPVPVLLPIASWNPSIESTQEFVARLLCQEYEFLKAPSGEGRSLAGQLVAKGRIIPVLDGLDELPSDWRPRALESLDHFAAAGRPLVVTCRGSEYEQAVMASGSIISRSAVVELEALDIGEAITFLSHPAPSRPRWKPVFEHLRQHPSGPLAEVLSTPLMVALARTAYRNPADDPADLLDIVSSAVLAASLIDRFITSVYQVDLPGLSGSKVPRLDGNGVRAVGWLSCLAYHLYLIGTREFWWWQLSPGLLSKRPGLPKSMIPIFSMFVAACGGLTIGLVTGLWSPARCAGVAAVIVGANALRLFRELWPSGYPPYVARKYRTTVRRRRRQHFVVGMAFGVFFGLMAGLLMNALLLGLVGGLVCGLFAAFAPSSSPSRRIRRSTPRMTLRANQRNTITAAILYGLVSSVIFGTFARFTPGSPSPLTAALTGGLIYAVAAAYGAGLWTWTRFRMTQMLLAWHGRLPWRFWAFLEDAYSREVLRHDGTAWQFRHGLLQDHLAQKVRLEHLRALASAGDGNAANSLADLLAGQGQVDDAIAVLRPYAAGDQLVTERVVALLTEQGRVDDAIVVLRTRADARDWGAAPLLAELLARYGRLDELRARAETGDADARRQIADLLAEDGRVDELQARADTGDREALKRLVTLLAEQGHTDDAIAILMPHSNVPVHRHQLVKLLGQEGRVEELQALAHNWDAAEQLAGLLAEQGRIDNAIAVVRPHAEAHTGDAPWRLDDLLAQQGNVQELRARADGGELSAIRRLADLFAQQGRIEDAIAIVGPLGNSGDEWAGERLAELFAGQGRFDDALTILKAHAAIGQRGPAFMLTDLLEGLGRTDQLNGGQWLAEKLAKQGRVDKLRTLADGGDPYAAKRLAELFAGEGRTDELHARADAGDQNAAELLADLLAKRGYVDDAIAVLRAHIRTGYEVRFGHDLGSGYMAWKLSDLLARYGRADEAIAILRPYADGGDVVAAKRLAHLLAEHQHIDELQARCDAGDSAAAQGLADLLARQGQVDEAIAILRTRADRGDRDTAKRLAHLLAEHQHIDELQARCDAGDSAAAQGLADLLARQGQVDEAIAILRPHVHSGGSDAAEQFINLLQAHDRVSELRMLADADIKDVHSIRRWDAARHLADLLAKLGRIDELRARGDAGDKEAAMRLADLLAEQGRIDDATAILRTRAYVGDWKAVRRLAEMLTEHGRIDPVPDPLPGTNLTKN